MSRIKLPSNVSIKSAIPSISKDNKFMKLAKASAIKFRKIFNMETPNTKITPKQERQAYFSLYEKMSLVLAKKVSVKGREEKVSLAEVVREQKASSRTDERLKSWFDGFNPVMAENTPQVSLDKGVAITKHKEIAFDDDVEIDLS